MSTLLKTRPTRDSGKEHLLMWCAANLSDPAHVRNVLAGAYGQDLGNGKLFPNPLLLANGHSGPSPKTSAYFGTRGLKKIASKAIDRGGAMLSAETAGINVGATGRSANAGYSTARHLRELKKFSTGATKQSQTLTAWLDMAINIKQRKGGRAAADVIANLIPLISSAPGVSDGVNAIKDMFNKAPEEALIARFAMEIHWRAYQELFMASHLSGASGGKAVGPASAIYYEIFTRYGATAIFRSYDKSELVKEPASWFALFDKLSL